MASPSFARGLAAFGMGSGVVTGRRGRRPESGLFPPLYKTPTHTHIFICPTPNGAEHVMRERAVKLSCEDFGRGSGAVAESKRSVTTPMYPEPHQSPWWLYACCGFSVSCRRLCSWRCSFTRELSQHHGPPRTWCGCHQHPVHQCWSRIPTLHTSSCQHQPLAAEDAFSYVFARLSGLQQLFDGSTNHTLAYPGLRCAYPGNL